MKKLLLLFISAPLCAGEFERFGALPLGAQAGSGALGAGLGYLFLQSSLPQQGSPGTGAAAISLSVGYALGVIFCGKFFSGKGNPFLTLLGSIVPLLGPLLTYHWSAGSAGFSESLALFNLHQARLSLSLGLPLPYRKAEYQTLASDTIYYLNLAMIHL